MPAAVLPSASLHTTFHCKPITQWSCAAMALESRYLVLRQYLLVVYLNMRFMNL